MRSRILLSYHYVKNKDLDRLIPSVFSPPYPDILLDSGAWSAFTQGVEISLSEYVDFIKRFRHWFTVYSNLDNMVDAERTLYNQLAIEDAGLMPFPVFHTGEDWSYLERYIEQYNYVALGKIIPYTNAPKKIFPWIVRAFEMAGSKTVFHGFGVTNYKLLSSFAWYSADSSSWSSGFRFGNVGVFDWKRGKPEIIRLGSYQESFCNWEILRSYGIAPEQLAESRTTKEIQDDLCGVASMSYIAMENYLRRRHGVIHLPSEVDKKSPAGAGVSGDGIRVYLASSSESHLSGIVRGAGARVAEMENIIQQINEV